MKIVSVLLFFCFVILVGINLSCGRVVSSGTTTTTSTTTTTLDTTPPEVASVIPADNATDVSRNTAISATFSEAMDAESLNSATFFLVLNDVAIAGTVSYEASSKTAILTPPAVLVANATYEVEIAASVSDEAGNQLGALQFWNFTTGATTDATQPTIESFYPAHNDIFMPVELNVTVTFSEDMDQSTIIPEYFYLFLSGTAVVSGEISYDALTRTATYAPTANLQYNSVYSMVVTNNLKDLSGNNLSQNFTWNFSTETTTTTSGTNTTSTTTTTSTTNTTQAGATTTTTTGTTNTTQAGATTTTTTTTTLVGSYWIRATDEAGFTARAYHTSVTFEVSGTVKMLVIGGKNASSVVFNDVWSSSDGISWQEITQIASFSARGEHCSVVFDNKMWVIGGISNTDVWSSPDGATWTVATAEVPFGIRADAGCVIFDNKFWLIGGFNGVDRFDDIWSSIDGVSWVREVEHAAFTPRMGLGVVVFDDGGGEKLWLMGGNDDSPYVSDVWSSSDGITWNQATVEIVSGGILNPELLVYDNKIWIVGAYRQDTSVWNSPDGINWTRVTNTAAFDADGHTSLLYDNKMWVIGREWDNDVWYTELQ